MKIYDIDGKRYRLPNELTDFQLKLTFPPKTSPV